MNTAPEGLFRRVELLLGSEGLTRLQNARVAVFGLGAVGSFAVEALARSGIGHLRLIDFDGVKASNVNRQLYALSSTLGRPKVELAVERVRDINPDIEVDARPAFFCQEEAERLLAPSLDYVVDAIDSLNPKVALIQACHQRGLPLVTSMGAASRTDPTRLHVSDLFESRVCPLAQKIRKRLSKAGIHDGVTAVWSDEPPCPIQAPDSEAGEEDVLQRGRVRKPLPSLIHLPAMFGLLASHHVVWSLAGRA